MSTDLGARLRTAKESLSEWYDRLNSQWIDAENAFHSLNLPTDVRVCYFTQEDPGEVDYEEMLNVIEHGEAVEICLAYMYLGDHGWRICYSVGDFEGNPDAHQPRPILDCSLKGRIVALELLPALVEKAVATVEAQSDRIEVALGGAAKSLAILKMQR